MPSIWFGTLLVPNGGKMRENNTSRGQRVGPTNSFIEFKKEEIEQSISDRFEQMVLLFPDQLAVKIRSHQITYDELNKAANRGACYPSGERETYYSK